MKNKLIDSIYNNKSFYNLINEIRLIIFHSDNDFLLQKFEEFKIIDPEIAY